MKICCLRLLASSRKRKRKHAFTDLPYCHTHELHLGIDGLLCVHRFCYCLGSWADCGIQLKWMVQEQSVVEAAGLTRRRADVVLMLHLHLPTPNILNLLKQSPVTLRFPGLQQESLCCSRLLKTESQNCKENNISCSGGREGKYSCSLFRQLFLVQKYQAPCHFPEQHIRTVWKVKIPELLK